MLKRIDEKDRIAELLEKYAPLIEKAFLDALAGIRDAVILKTIIEKLEKRDIDGAVRALDIDTDAFARFELAIAEAYNNGGLAFVQNLPRLTDPQGHVVNFRFAVRNTPGEAWLRQHSAGLVTRTTEEMKEAVRTAFSEGLAQGRNPTRTATQIIGAYNPRSKKREGGILGLTAPQERFVASARAELSSGDPAALRNYLQRNRRDKRFDRTIAKAIADEKPLPQAMVDKIAGRYADKLLALRGDMIGLTETMSALEKSRADAIRQQIVAGKLDQRDVVKTWHHHPQERPRLQHIAMNNTSVGVDDKFQLPDGTMMDHPHDPNAPASQTIFCRCWLEYSILRFNRNLGRE